MTSRIRIKVGATEVEFEGSEDFMKESLPKLIELLQDMAPAQDNEPEEVSEVVPPSTDPAKRKLEMTTNTIATKLGVTSGAELALAACAHLSLVKGVDTFKRAHILGEMKLASNYYKQTFSNNLSKSLRTLVKGGKLLETAQDTYALVAKAKKELEAKLNVS